MNKNQLEKLLSDGATQLCLNSNGVGCRQVLFVGEFYVRRRQRKSGTWHYALEKLCVECQNRLARSMRFVEPKTLNNPDFGANNKKEPLRHVGPKGIDRSFFVGVKPTKVDRVSRYHHENV